MPPRTKQTCKKSTGGDAPRVTLKLLGAVSTVSRVEVGTARIEEEERTDHNNGFYRDRKPVFDTFLQICGALELSHQAQRRAALSNSRTIFLCLTFLTVESFFVRSPSTSGSDSKIVKFHSMVDKLVLELLAFPGGWKLHYLWDLRQYRQYLRRPLCRLRGQENFILLLQSILISSTLLSNRTYGCSVAVHYCQQLRELRKLEGPQYSTFNAVRFQPSFTTHLLLAFIERVIIERFAISHAFPLMLTHSLNLGRHSDILLLVKNSDSLNVTKFAWTHTVFRPWGQYLPVQCPKYWTSSFRAILVSYKSKFLAAKDSKSERSCVIKKIRKAIVAAHKEQGEQVPLPSPLKKAIKKYYGRKTDEEESDEEGAAKAREISARPKEAAFYKKTLTDWDVAQRLFKQEMDEFNKAEQARKGVKDPIKFCTRHAREWFNQMSLTQKKEVDYAREKWNMEGAPEESQVIYHKNNLKKVLEDFSEQLHRTMGCHVVMLVSHKKQANQTLNVTLHESQPRNVKKSFSVSSDGIKEWTSTGFEFFAEWAKGKFYPTADQDNKEEEEHGLPELILDDEGYAQLPSCDGIRLKDQQELVHMIFHAAYKVFTGSRYQCHLEVLGESECGKQEACLFYQGKTIGHETQWFSTDSSYLELVDAVKDLANMTEKIPTLQEELDLPPWVDWHCGESYLPEYLHGSQDMVMASLELLTNASIRSSHSAALVVLGLGLILRDCKRVIEYEEEEALPGTPSYLASLIMDLQCMIKVDSAISHTASSIVGLIELAMKATSGNFNDSNQGEMGGVDGKDKDQEEDEDEEEDKDEDEEEDKDKEEKEKEKDQDDEQEEVTGDSDVQMQEVEKDDKVGKSKGKKRIYLKLTWPAHWLCGLQSWLAKGWRPGGYKSTGGMASMASTWATGQTGH
ncbi:hypothetical protein EV424DRAFT_1347324 [Suillus variegatus]|nr:hypothetical protein EV424DRAFT_1347324 [Suillus variegatus]